VSFPTPRPGLVIRYGFLWSHEKSRGAEEASKDRPCAIVVATATTLAGVVQVIVSPITHSPPDDPDDSIEMPRDACAALGLDSGRHWLRLDELNRFVWPGFDLRQIPGQDAYAYGMLPASLYGRLRQGILARQAAKQIKVQRRD
jgi:hypothetical protein